MAEITIQSMSLHGQRLLQTSPEKQAITHIQSNPHEQRPLPHLPLETTNLTDIPSTSSLSPSTPTSADPPILLYSNILITSPYTEPAHLLDLRALDTQDKLMALALTKMTNITNAYATEPYPNSFNWPMIMKTLSNLCKTHNHSWTSSSFYCVVFTSQLRATCDYADLSSLDKLSHAEATASGGFLKYWFGEPDEEKRNLATCIWRSKEDARKGSTGPHHAIAAKVAWPSYESYGIQGLRLVVGDGVRSWRFEKWVD